MQTAEGSLSPVPKVQPADRLGTVVPAPPALRDADLGNVILLAQHRRGEKIEAPAITVDTSERPAPYSAAADKPQPWVALLAAALLLHFALALAFLREPGPLASVGLESISVEIVLGADQNAGLAKQPSESESVPAPESAASDAQAARSEPEPQKVAEPEQKKVAEPEPEKIAESEPVKTEQPLVAPAEPEPKPQPAQTEAEAAAEMPAEPQQIETTAAPAQTQPEKPPVAEKPAAVEKPVQRPVAKKKAAAPSRASTPSAGSSGIGRGRSTLDRNYPGVVAAHLARHKQYPAEARNRGAGGVASVSFSLDGSGRVTAVRLTRSSGVASLDAETQAMVRRASPFPPPPSGRGMSFTVPVSFNLR